MRERLLNGVVEAVAEHGYNATTIGALTAAAQISRRTFYVRDQVLIRGIATLIARRRNAGEPVRLPEPLPNLTALALRPY